MAKKNSINNYIDSIGNFFSVFPDLSKGATQPIISIIPWLALIFGTLGIAAAVVGLGIFTIIEPIAQVTGVKRTGFDFIFVLLSLVSSALLLSAFAKTQRKEKKGWQLLYYSESAALLSDVLSKDIVGILLSLLVFYILYQIRSYYTK